VLIVRHKTFVPVKSTIKAVQPRNEFLLNNPPIPCIRKATLKHSNTYVTNGMFRQIKVSTHRDTNVGISDVNLVAIKSP
jgi:hypothetical protein